MAHLAVRTWARPPPPPRPPPLLPLVAADSPRRRRLLTPLPLPLCRQAALSSSSPSSSQLRLRLPRPRCPPRPSPDLLSFVAPRPSGSGFGATFGEIFKHQSRFLVVITKIVELASGFSLSDLFPSLRFLDVIMMRKIAKVHREVDAIFDDTIQDHQEKLQKPDGEEDLLDVLLKAREQKDLEVAVTRENVKAVMLDIFAGGTETSSTIMEWTMSELIKSPNIMAKAQQEVRETFKEKSKIEEHDISELSYLQLVIKETLRLHPPIPLLLPRVCQETCNILGYTIPAGTRIVINVWALGRDPKYWEDPEKFMPERFEGSTVDYKGSNFEFLPFGAGRRICPGINFGLATVEFGLAQLLFHFDWKLPDDMKIEDLDMTETFGASAARKEQLRLIAIPRIPLQVE